MRLGMGHPALSMRDTGSGTLTRAAGRQHQDFTCPEGARSPWHLPVGWELSVEGMKSSS